METRPTTSRSLDAYYHINGDTFEKQYKEVLSGYRRWNEYSHADEWLIFPENVGKRLCIDETSISDGELYTIVSNPEARGREGSLVALVKGVSSNDVIDTLKLIPEDKRSVVEEVTMDLSNSMNLIIRRCFPKAKRTIDRFHVQKLTCDALQEMRIAHRWPIRMQKKKLRKKEKIISQPHLQTVIRKNNCWHGVDIYCSNPWTNGRKAKRKERQYCLISIPI